MYAGIRCPRWLKDFHDFFWVWESRNRPCLLTHSRLGKLWAVLLSVWDLRPTSFGRFNDLNLTLTDAQKAGQDSNSFDWSERAEATNHITNTRQMAGTIRWAKNRNGINLATSSGTDLAFKFHPQTRFCWISKCVFCMESNRGSQDQVRFSLHVQDGLVDVVEDYLETEKKDMLSGSSKSF